MTRWVLVSVSVLLGTGTALAQVSLAAFNSTAREVKNPQQLAQIDLELSHSRLLKLDRPFKSIVVGNPDIADVTIQDPRTILINAKAQDPKAKIKNGTTTNLILLDDANEPIYSVEIAVHERTINLSPPPPPPPRKEDVMEPLGRMRIFSGGGKSKLVDYIPYACSEIDCIRLKPELQNELSRDVSTPGLAQSQPPKASNEEPPQSAPGPMTAAPNSKNAD
jgi:Pilus formation protein N terminal region